MPAKPKVKIIWFNHTNTKSAETQLAELIAEGWRIVSTGTVSVETKPVTSPANPYEASFAYGKPASSAPKQRPPYGFAILQNQTQAPPNDTPTEK